MMFACFATKSAEKSTGKKYIYLTICTHVLAKSYIKYLIKGHKDAALSAKVGNTDFHTKEVRYHNKCRKDYADSLKKKGWPRKRGLYHEVHEELYGKVGENSERQQAFVG